jgi:hypothetical protein
MKFFDYKFIILLGLTIVVYFIYREIEYLRIKINRIEKDIINIHDSTNKSHILAQLPNKIARVKPIITEPCTTLQCNEPDISIEEAEYTAPDKLTCTVKQCNESVEHIIDDLSKIKLNIISDLYPIINTCNYTQKINNLIIIDEDNSEHCDYSTNIDSPCHLAIYSNENDSCENTQDEKQIDNTNTLLESISGDTNTLLESIPNNTNTLLESIPGDTNTLLESIPGNTNTLLESIPGNTNTLLESIPGNTNTLLENLDKHKLYEIKKIAEDNKIHINKKINGVYKPKTKNELIMEIIELKNI